MGRGVLHARGANYCISFSVHIHTYIYEGICIGIHIHIKIYRLSTVTVAQSIVYTSLYIYIYTYIHIGICIYIKVYRLSTVTTHGHRRLECARWTQREDRETRCITPSAETRRCCFWAPFSICLSVYIHTYIYVCIYIYVHTYICMYTYIHICMCVCVHVYKYISIYLYT